MRSVVPWVAGLSLTGGALGAVILLLGAAAPQRSDPPPAQVLYRIPLHGVVEYGLAPFIKRSLQEAAAAHAAAAVLDMETPGGRIDAAEEIVDAVQDAPLPVYTFVDRRAFSAGAMIALATAHIYMRPGAVLGAATPVTGNGHKASEKIVSAMRSEMRSLAQAHGLDPAVAEAMVDEDIAVPGVVPAGQLLTLTTDEAVRVGYATEVENWHGLLSALRMTAATVTVTRVNWVEAVVRFLSHPAVAPLLLSLGFLGLLMELKTPTFGLAGSAGLVSLLLFFGSRYLVGLAGSEALLLLGGGLVLLAIEIFITPGFGLAGVAGLLAVGASIYLSLVGQMASAADVGQAIGIISLSVVVVLVVAWGVIRHLPRSRHFGTSGILLGDATSKETGYLSSAVRPELVGTVGIALTDLRPAGTARFGDERLDVVADSSWISAGTPVRIIRAEGYRHVVLPAE